MNTLCIAPCGDRKIWKKYPEAGPQKARLVYTGPYASTCIAYANRFYSNWCILSAKYGFLFPNDIISGPYNATFKNKSTNPITIEKMAIQAKEKELVKFEYLVVLGGKEYNEIVRKVFPFASISRPLDGLRMGPSISKLRKAIQSGILL